MLFMKFAGVLGIKQVFLDESASAAPINIVVLKLWVSFGAESNQLNSASLLRYSSLRPAYVQNNVTRSVYLRSISVSLSL